MNSIYLLSCHFARPGTICTVDMETAFLTRTLQEITAALDKSDRLVDIVRASCLLAIYLFANGRILEGYCHSFSAARLAVALGLHRLPNPKEFQYTQTQTQGSPSASSSSSYGTEESYAIPGLLTGLGPSTTSHMPLPPPESQEELRDRISAFWEVFMVDRCWSVANGLPVALPDGECSEGRIRTPWPEPSPGSSHAHDGVLGQGSGTAALSAGVYMPAVKAKAAALYERTFRLASCESRNSFWIQRESVAHFR